MALKLALRTTAKHRVVCQLGQNNGAEATVDVVVQSMAIQTS